MQHKNWACEKCRNREFETGEMRVAGGFWSKIFDVQGRQFFSVTCTNCKYTEFYQGSSSLYSNIFDLFTQ